MPGDRYPSHLRRLLELVEQDFARAWTVDDLAKASGIARRTLQKQFRRYLGCTPVEHLRAVRLQRAREEILRSSTATSVTQIAAACGFAHQGRFATWYRARYGETPSATQRLAQTKYDLRVTIPLLSSRFERPVLAVLPFEATGNNANLVASMADEIVHSILQLRWIAIATPSRARYHLSGRVRGDGDGRLRVTVLLRDALAECTVWADYWDGKTDNRIEFETRVATRVAQAIEPALRDAEINRATGKRPEELGAWELTIRALPGVLSYDAISESHALELLERAIDIAPQDPLPKSLAAWCRAVRSCLHFSDDPQAERDAAQALAARAALQNRGDALTETALAASYTLTKDFSAARLHVDRALLLNGGSAWAWGRSAWIGAYSGEGVHAIERFKIARALAPIDPLSAMCCFGIAAPLMETDRHAEAIPWITRGIAEGCRAGWINPFLAAAYALESRKSEARRCLVEWKRAFPDMTLKQIRSGLPFGSALFERVAEGLESVGLRDPQ